jgi:SAM-dependent methyltransferase
MSWSELAAVAGKFGTPVHPSGSEVPTADEVFLALGAREVHSLDTSTYEDATVIHDLNYPVPVEMQNKFDVVYDGGTMEHVFHVPQVLANIYSLIRNGGVAIHASPSHNHVDHGFYMFSPILFADWYSANHFEVLDELIFTYTPDHSRRPWRAYPCTPGSLDYLSFGAWGNEMVGIWFVGRKTPCSASDVIPQQGRYQRLLGWGG